METSIVLMFFLFGIMGGFIAGLLGVGGGVLFVPCLYHGFVWMDVSPDRAMHLAVGTSLAIIIVASLSSSLGHAIHGALTGGQVLSMATLAIPSSVLGAAVASEIIGGELLRILFGLFLLFVSYRFIRPMPDSNQDPDRIVPVSQLAMVGGASGFISAMLGIGGGIITVSLLHLVLGVPIHRAVANSSGLIVFSSIAGALSWAYAGMGEEGLPAFSVGNVNLVAWSIISVGAVVFAQVGAWVASKSKPERLRKPFAVLLFLVGVKMAIPESWLGWLA